MDDVIAMVRRYGDLREEAPIESECGSPARADEIEAEAAVLLRRIEAELTPARTWDVEHRDLAQHQRVAASVLGQLPGLHARAREHWGPALNVAAVLREETQRRRVRFVSRGTSYSMLGCNEIDAIVHAAEHGYRTCGEPAGQDRCWLPVGHRGDCCGDLWYWSLLYGQPEDDPAITVVCSTCTPHRHVPRPADCPH